MNRVLVAASAALFLAPASCSRMACAEDAAFASVVAGLSEAPESHSFTGELRAASSHRFDGPDGIGFGVAEVDRFHVGAVGIGVSSNVINYDGNGEGIWHRMTHIEFSGPSTVPPPYNNVLLEFKFRFTWSIEGAGHYSVTLFNKSTFFSTIGGPFQNDFDLPTTRSGSRIITAIVPLESWQFVSEPATFIADVTIDFSAGAGAASGYLVDFNTYPNSRADVYLEYIGFDGYVQQSTNYSPMIAMSDPDYSNPPLLADGDFDGDGAIDGGDFLGWQRGYGLTSGALLSDGDATHDGDVDDQDLFLWGSQFGATEPSTAARIPEPAAAALLSLAAVALARLTRAPRRSEVGCGER